MAKPKKIFARAELDSMIEAMGINWHRHGDQDLDRVSKYLRRLYDSVPSELKEKNLNEVLLLPLDRVRELSLEALTPFFSEEEVDLDMATLRENLLNSGAENSPRGFLVRRQTFIDVFGLLFNEVYLNEELAARMEKVKDEILG